MMIIKENKIGFKKKMNLEMELEFQQLTMYKYLITKTEFPSKEKFNISKMIQLNAFSLLIH